jgi:RNA polymerase sigma factor (sigma-70 family)
MSSSSHESDPGPLERTIDLIRLARTGDTAAVDQLASRYLPLLQTWAHGRLPAYARDLADTEDLVQVALMRALAHLDEFESTREGAFLAYLRHCVLNLLRDHVRRATRRPSVQEFTEEIADPGLVAQSVGIEDLVAYENALEQLPERQQEAVILRIEFGFRYEEIARSLDMPSAAAARMAIKRALARLAELMD